MFFKRFMPGKGKSVAQAASAADASAPGNTSATTDVADASVINDDGAKNGASVARAVAKAISRKANGVRRPAPATDAAELGFKTTADLTPSPAPVGQDKALEALTFGATMKGSGHHILVTGDTGTGRRTATRTILRAVAGDMQPPDDWVYVSTFATDGAFRALKLPAGTARRFAEKMALAIDQLADALPVAFADADYDLKRRMIEVEQRLTRDDALEALRREAEAQNIALLRTAAGMAVAPILEGKVVKTDVFNAIPEPMRREVEAKIAAVEAQVEAILSDRPEDEKERRTRIGALTEEIAASHVQVALADLNAEFGEIADVASHLAATGRDLIYNVGLFVAHANEGADGTGSTAGRAAGRESSTVRLVKSAAAHPRFARYGVHVMAASSADGSAPIVEEPNPSYSNLFARIELTHDADGLATVARVRPGALHGANGGFLLLDADALLSAGAAVEPLLRALETEQICFDPPTEPIGIVGDEIPELEPIPLNVKLVLVASDASLQQLSASHAALKHMFKSQARFEAEIAHSADNIAKFAGLVAYVAEKHDLRPFGADAVAALVDEAAQRAGEAMLSLPVSDLVDLCRAADHWADNEDRKTIAADDVTHAVRHLYGSDGAERETRRALP